MITDAQVLAAMRFLDQCDQGDAWGTEKVREMLEAADAAAWRPIAEAPRDETVIDVWLQESLNDIRFYCTAKPLFIREGVYGGRAAGWYWKDDKFRPYLWRLSVPVSVVPTHWRLPPPPPKSACYE